MQIVGFETLPRRMTDFPATSWSPAFVMSRSSPRFPFSPGAPPGQSSMTLTASEARPTDRVTRTQKRRPIKRLDFTGPEKPFSLSLSKQFHEPKSASSCAQTSALSLPPCCVTDWMPTVSYLFTVATDFQSAVSPICNRQSLGDSQDLGIRARSAGYKPAIQRSAAKPQPKE